MTNKEYNELKTGDKIIYCGTTGTINDTEVDVLNTLRLKIKWELKKSDELMFLPHPDIFYNYYGFIKLLRSKDSNLKCRK
jgi:hypothetical protein